MVVRAFILSALVIVTVALLLLVSVLKTARYLVRTGRGVKPESADVAMVLGAYTRGYKPSRTLSDRLKAALHLYRLGYVRFVIVCGGRGDDETITESSSMKRFLVVNGVPAQVIIEEARSSDTWENLRNGKRVMEHHALHSAIIVTSDYHLPRALSIARLLDMQVTGYAALSRAVDLRYAVREVFALVIYGLRGQLSWRNHGS